MSKLERNGLIDAFASLPQALLLSTPAVEVGVDFAADTLITQECDGNAFLQRFGRVGRRQGIQGKVMVFLKRSEVVVKLQRVPESLSRQAFSELITHPNTGLFPHRTYTQPSLLVDTIHWIINEHLGDIGTWLNMQMFSPGLGAFARRFQEAHLSFSFGLRSTLPSISLKGDYHERVHHPASKWSFREEIVYAWDIYDLHDCPGFMLLDRTAGACFALYQRMLAHVARKV